MQLDKSLSGKQKETEKKDYDPGILQGRIQHPTPIKCYKEEHSVIQRLLFKMQRCEYTYPRAQQPPVIKTKTKATGDVKTIGVNALQEDLI